MMAPAGRRAALPKQPIERPRLGDSLEVVVREEDGSDQGTYDFALLPGPNRVRGELARAFAATSGPNGSWRRAVTCRHGFKTLAHFATWLAGRPVEVESLTQLTPGMWNDWRVTIASEKSRTAHSLRLRTVLRKAPEVAPRTLAVMNRRLPLSASDPSESYSVPELRRIHRAARRTVRAARDRIVASTDVGGTIPDLGRPDYFLTPREAAASILLLACERGWNRSVIEDMSVPRARADAQDGSEPPIFIADMEKPRAGRDGRHMNASLASGAGGEAIAAVIEATEPARRHLGSQGIATDRLIIYRRYRSVDGTQGIRVGLPKHEVGIEWAEEHGLKHDDGSSMSPSARRIRKTLQVLDRQPRQNSRAVHNRAYVMPDPQVRRDAVVAVTEGQELALRTAQATLAARVIDRTTYDLIKRDPEAASEKTGLPAPVLIEVAEGARDTAATACLDMFDSPWQPDGALCRSSFLLCLLCRNAVATPAHLPKLVYLRSALEALSSTVPSEVWNDQWAAHYARTLDAIASIATPEEQQTARPSDEDRALIDSLIAGRLDA